MKKSLLLILFTISFKSILFSQIVPGEWTWMNGDNTLNSTGVFGTQGVSSPANTPRALYEACEWTDNQGNFWLYGGIDLTIVQTYGDLWKCNPSTNEWTWVKGPGIPGQPAIYGVQGVPSINNSPGARGWGVLTWTDANGDLWLFGGNGAGSGSWMNDLWRYNISSNEWTWMSGSDTGPYTGDYGTIGISSPSNQPPGRAETSCSWVENNNLWFFGGQSPFYSGTFFHNDLWKYNISTNEWTWMKGSNLIGSQSGVYGTQGVAAPANTPGGRMVYSKWKDNNGNLWLFGGAGCASSSLGDMLNDVWKYEIASNNWTWMFGANIVDSQGNGAIKCTPSINYLPSGRTENRACWSDNCGNLWTFGGICNFTGNNLNDLWHLNISTGEWTLVSGNPNASQSGIYGIKTVSAASNIPGGREGAVSWKDNNGNLWLFGGTINPWEDCSNDLWRFVPDATCPAITNSIINPFGSDTIVCGINSITLDAENSGCNYLWSTNETTQTINVSTSGTYSVTITNPNCGSVTDDINVTFATSPTVFLGNDTSLCGSSSSIILNAHNNGCSYLWSTGEYSQNITVTTSGNYSVSVTCGNCPIGKDDININISNQGASLYFPNTFTPEKDGLNEEFKGVGEGIISYNLKIFDRWGENIFETNNINESWDGKYKGNLCESAIYVYIVEYKYACNPDKTNTKYSSVLLLK
jgi:gliding motility-associated-like protein